jgi:hypothetical protein
MFTPLLDRRAALLSAAATLAAAALAGTVGTAQARTATIYACYKKRAGIVRIVAKRTRCRRGERRLSWNTVGPPGAGGRNGLNGANGLNGSNGLNGLTGFTSTLPSGKSEQGVYAATGTASSGMPAWVPVSFVIPLAAALPAASVSAIAPGGAPTAECPGSPRAPQAAPGHLCVYEAANFNTSGPLIFNPATEEGEPGSGPYGFVVRFSPTVKTSDWGGYGTWAVTG